MSEAIDMSEFEGEFSYWAPSDLDKVTFERMAFLRDRMSDLKEVNEVRKEDVFSLSELREEKRVLEKRIEELLKRVRARRIPLDNEITETNRLMRHDGYSLETLEREWARLIAELEARRRLRLEQRAVDKKTKDAPWRTRALKHQIEGAQRLCSVQSGILGDKPGLGKTLQAIMTIDMLRAKGQAKKILIFVPKGVLQDFAREFAKWSPDQFVHILDHAGRGNKFMLLNEVIPHLDECVILTNYEVWRKDKQIIDAMIKCQFDTLILDEAHALKTKESSTFKGIRKIRYADNKCSKCGHFGTIRRAYIMICGNPDCFYEPTKTNAFCSVKNCVPMTGTAILNEPKDLWPLLNLIDRVGFPEERNFLYDYCTQKYDDNSGKTFWTFGSGGSERLLAKLGLKYTARTRESAGVVMPPQEIKHHYLELDPDDYPRQHKFVKVLTEKAQLVFGDSKVTTTETIQWYTRMRQAASWPDAIKVKQCLHEPECWDEVKNKSNCKDKTVVFPPADAPPVGESVLMDGAEEICYEAVKSENRIVVFSHFNSVIEELRRRLEDVGHMRVAVYNGDTPEKARQAIVDDFNENHTKKGEHKYDVLICQYKSGSVGLNLSGAQEVLFVEREWNPGKEEQAGDRVRRLDSKYDSVVHVLHAPGTATDLIDIIIDLKKQVIDGFETDVNLAEEMRKFLEG